MPARAPNPRQPVGGTRRTERIVWALLVMIVAGVAVVGVWRFVAGSRAARALPVFGTVPAFSLIERSGRSVSSDDLAGSIWIADFIFTRCAGTCPILSNRLAALLRRLSERGILDVRAVSFTVDPARDDPAALRRYAQRFGADETRWLFVTGDRAAIEQLVRDGFHLSIAELPPGEREAALEPITHSDRFVLVDGQRRIRGYYHGTDDDGLAELERDVAHLTGDV
jgi:cytochrome oxidase Cu insertion factor (SCO1/SenC/PrrC family)